MSLDEGLAPQEPGDTNEPGESAEFEETAEFEQTAELEETAETSEPDGAEGEIDAEQGEAAETKRRGFYLTPRQTFTWLAGILAVLLIALLLYLLWLLRPGDLTEKGGETQGGLVPVVAIYGPGRDPLPTFDQPMGVAWSRDGSRIYVADARNNRICVFDKNGKPIREFGKLGVAKPLEGAPRTWNPGELSYPVDVAVDEDGFAYVADFYNDSISVFNQEGTFVRRFPDPYKPTGKGSSGNNGGGIAVTAVTVAGDKVYATDTYQILVFTKAGKLVKQFGRPGPGPEGLDHPGGIAVSRDGVTYVADSNHNRVVAYSADGKPMWVTGRPVADTKQESDNPFVLPRGLTILPDGSIIVADPLAQQLVMLDADGKVVAEYGVRGRVEGQVNFPNDVASSSDQILIADRQNERAQVVTLSNR